MTELLTDKKVLEEMKPDIALLKTIIQLKHLMNGEVLQAALKIAKQVADDIKQKLDMTIKRSLTGRLDKNTSSVMKCSANLDFKKTIRRNLKNYDKASNQLILKDIYLSGSLLQKCGNNYVIVCGTAGTYLEMGSDGKAIRRYNYGSGLDSVQKLTLSGMYFYGI